MRKNSKSSSYGCAYDLINKMGLNALLNIMKDYNYDYDTPLYDITKIIQKRYTVNQRERYSIDYIFEVKIILEHIKKNNLLEKE